MYSSSCVKENKKFSYKLEEQTAGIVSVLYYVIGFFGGGIFSNFYNVSFIVDGVTFNCTEQAFHYFKALHFGDIETAEKILKEETPKGQKKLGRQVKNFDPKIWNEMSFDVMLRILDAKFRVPELLDELLATGNAILVECSPDDGYWGINKSLDDMSSYLEENKDKIASGVDVFESLGKNMLGKALMQIREKLRSV